MKMFRTAALVAVLLLLGALLLLWIPADPSFASHPQPTLTYAEAMTRSEQLLAQDSDAHFPECHSVLLTHGEPMPHVIVFFHGLVSCPAQFAALGQQFYDRGYNVLIPRLPHHGWADPMTEDTANLTAEELIAAADQAVDIAAGLGEKVTVAGFSTGGVLAGWVAAERDDIDQTVLLSPFFSPNAYPAWLVRPLARALLIMPNQFWWWNITLQERLPGPRHGYPRYPSHAIAQILRLSFAIRDQAEQEPPRSPNILIITNAGERETVDTTVTQTLVGQWQQQEGTEIRTFEFDAALDLDHNYIDPDAPNQPVNLVEIVYPVLIEQITRDD